jgi:hypothetical protein
MANDTALASIPDPGPTALDVLIARDDVAIFAIAFDQLAAAQPVKAAVLAMRYGLGGLDVHSLERIAHEWCMSRGDVRRIEDRAIAALIDLTQTIKL